VHLVLDALVDVETERGGLVVLVDSFVDTDCCVAVLFYTLNGGLKRLESEAELFFVVVDPVIGTRTKKRMPTFQMRVLPEAQLTPPLRSPDR
jgi:hypothetical protein